jgi:hypothetical protein
MFSEIEFRYVCLSVAVIYVHEGSQSVTASLLEYYLGRGVAREHRGNL